MWLTKIPWGDSSWKDVYISLINWHVLRRCCFTCSSSMVTYSTCTCRTKHVSYVTIVSHFVTCCNGAVEEWCCFLFHVFLHFPQDCRLSTLFRPGLGPAVRGRTWQGADAVCLHGGAGPAAEAAEVAQRWSWGDAAKGRSPRGWTRGSALVRWEGAQVEAVTELVERPSAWVCWPSC